MKYFTVLIGSTLYKAYILHNERKKYGEKKIQEWDIYVNNWTAEMKNTTTFQSRAEPRCPLGGSWPLQKKKSPPTYRQILIGPPNDVHPAPSPISVQYFNSFPNSSFKCRPFYPLIKQNMAHNPLIFKYLKHYLTKQHFITHSPIQNQKI